MFGEICQQILALPNQWSLLVGLCAFETLVESPRANPFTTRSPPSQKKDRYVQNPANNESGTNWHL